VSARRGAAAPVEWRAASVERTEALGEKLGAHLREGDIVVLTGPLGAGKTRFVAGVARGAGVGARVRSPSFTLINEYRGRVRLLHLDLYRIEPADAGALGLEEQLERGALVAEWGEKLPAGLRREALVIAIEPLDEGTRALRAGAGEGRGLELLAAWTADCGEER
jgi:tRNA threonylcarbamoyladenosine biosynthesis protein TsaE